MSQPSCIYPVGWYRSAILVVAPFLFGVVIVNVLLMLFGYLYGVLRYSVAVCASFSWLSTELWWVAFGYDCVWRRIMILLSNVSRWSQGLCPFSISNACLRLWRQIYTEWKYLGIEWGTWDLDYACYRWFHGCASVIWRTFLDLLRRNRYFRMVYVNKWFH